MQYVRRKDTRKWQTIMTRMGYTSYHTFLTNVGSYDEQLHWKPSMEVSPISHSLRCSIASSVGLAQAAGSTMSSPYASNGFVAISSTLCKNAISFFSSRRLMASSSTHCLRMKRGLAAAILFRRSASDAPSSDRRTWYFCKKAFQSPRALSFRCSGTCEAGTRSSVSPLIQTAPTIGTTLRSRACAAREGSRTARKAR